MNPSKYHFHPLKPPGACSTGPASPCRAIFRSSLAIAISLVATIAYAQSNYATPYYFTTLAGSVGSAGILDGTGSAARFNTPIGVAVSADGTAYVADMNSHTIRKITSYGVVTTLAGMPNVSGPSTILGSGSAARFNLPRGVAVDSAGNVYVADTSNHAIRKITPDGTVTTLAGGTAGSMNGTGTGARFLSPNGVAVDAAGNVYVADTSNQAIRKITPGGVVTTLAGELLTFGSVDGTGTGARFSSPRGLAVDGTGTIYVADRDNNSIRKVSPAGVVTTLAGNLSFNTGSTDGTGSAARFNNPYGVAVDANGNVYTVEGGNHTVRKINPAGVVTTLAGAPVVPVGSTTDVVGSAVRFSDVQGIAVDGGGNLYVSDTSNQTIRMSVFPPVFTLHPASQIVPPGGTLFFTAAAISNVPIFGVTWEKNSTPGFLPYIASWIPGQTAMTTELFQTGVVEPQLGTYTVTATNMAGSTTSNVALLSFPTSNAGWLSNLSIRSNAGTGPQTLIVGMVIGGVDTAGAKPLLIRGVGPALGLFSVPGFLVDPILNVYSGTTVVSTNDNWNGDAQVTAIGGQVGAFAFTSATSRDAGLYNSALSSGDYTVQITGVGGTVGIALAEIYDATPNNIFTVATPRLVNVSARAQVGTGADILIAGFAIGGTTKKRVLIRAIGPTLAIFDVGGFLADPKLELHSDSAIVGFNDNWGGDASIVSTSQSVGAFGLATASKDAVLLVTLDPGSYTAHVSGVGGTTGVALVEIYEVP